VAILAPAVDHPDDAVPADIAALAEARAQARARRAFDEADSLRERIEAAGWKVVDDGPAWALSRARPADRQEDGRIVYGSSATVPAAAATEAAGGASVVLVLDGADGLEPGLRTVRGLAATAPAGTQVVIVADAGAIDRAAAVAGLRDATGAEPWEVGGDVGGEVGAGVDSTPVELVWLADGLGPGASLSAGLVRGSRGVVLALHPGAVPTGDIVGPAKAALGDATVAAACAQGLASADLHRFEPADGDGAIVASAPSCLAMRRADLAGLRIDERLAAYASVIIWCSLALREPSAQGGPRRLVVLDLPLDSPIAPAPARAPAPAPGDGDMESWREWPAIPRRDRYRIAGRFGPARI
jgi:hypothetical protein